MASALQCGCNSNEYYLVPRTLRVKVGRSELKCHCHKDVMFNRLKQEIDVADVAKSVASQVPLKFEVCRQLFCIRSNRMQVSEGVIEVMGKRTDTKYIGATCHMPLFCIL